MPRVAGSMGDIFGFLSIAREIVSNCSFDNNNLSAAKGNAISFVTVTNSIRYLLVGIFRQLNDSEISLKLFGTFNFWFIPPLAFVALALQLHTDDVPFTRNDSHRMDFKANTKNSVVWLLMHKPNCGGIIAT